MPIPGQSGNADQNRLLADLPTAPPKSTPWAREGGRVGVLTPDRFVASFFAADARESASAAEKRRGLQYAVRRKWHALDDTLTDITVVRYATTAGAESFYLSRADDSKDYDADGTSSIAGVPQGEVFTEKEFDSYENTQLEALARAGDTVITLFMLAPAKPSTEGAGALVAEIRQRICAQEAC